MPTLLPALEQYLPDRRLSILTFLTFKLPAAAPADPCFVRRENFVSELPPNSENFHEISSLQTPLIKSIQCPHEASVGGKRFPIATVLYWARIIAICKVQTCWKHAVERLQAKIDEDVDSVLLQAAFRAIISQPSSQPNG